MKKFLSLLVILSLLVSFASCGDSHDSSSVDRESKEQSTVVSQGSNAQSKEETPEGSHDSDDDQKDTEDVTIEALTSTEPTISDVSTDYGTSVSDSEVLSDKAYTVYIVNNNDGTYTVKALIPDKVGSGKIVVSASENLSLVSGSLSTTIKGGLVNEKYDRNGVKGACVVFASSTPFPKGTVAFTATYTAAEGAVITEKDIFVLEWNLTSGTKYLGTHRDSTVVIRYVSK